MFTENSFGNYTINTWVFLNVSVTVDLVRAQIQHISVFN